MPGVLRTGVLRTGVLRTFFEAGGFAFEGTEVIEFRAADAARANDIDVIDGAAMKWEDALDALAEANFSNGDGVAEAGVIACNEGAFENLDAFLIAFLDLDVDLQSIARTEDRNIRSEVFLDEITK